MPIHAPPQTGGRIHRLTIEAWRARTRAFASRLASQKTYFIDSLVKLHRQRGIRNMAQYRENKLTLRAEKLYLDLMYCRADAQLGGMATVAHLLNLACEEMQKIADAGKSGIPPQSDWNAFHVYQDMK
jgi:hypothetical protein